MKKKQKIFFVYPPANKIYREGCTMQITEQMSVLPHPVPVDMMSLSAIAKKRGYETFFKDYGFENETTYDFLRDLRMFNPDFLVIDVASTNVEEDLSILISADELLEDVAVIVKGSIFNYNSYAIMQNYPRIDIAIRGCAEEAFDEIIQYKSLKNIKGITYKIDNKITSTSDREQKENLDFLPFLDRDLIDNFAYIRPDTRRPQTAIKVSHGCADDCFLCRSSDFNSSKLCFRNPELVVAEIKKCVIKYHIKDFIFYSDAFNYDNSWVQRLCRLILEEGLAINFAVNLRADMINPETLPLMKKAGCYLVSIGVESANSEILDKIGNNVKLSQIKTAVKLIEKAGIMVNACYILGLPWETKKTIKQTYKFAKSLNTRFANFYCAVPLIGTKFYDFVMKNRLGDINYQNPYVFPCVKSYTLTCEEIYGYYKKLNKNYYLRPLYIAKLLKEINSFDKLKKYFEIYKALIQKN